MPRPNLITGRSAGAGIARLLAEQASEAELRKAAQWNPGSVAPAALIVEPENEMTLTLPWAPSMNAYWGLRVTSNGQRIMVVTKQGKRYQKLVAGLVAIRWRRPPIDYYVAVLMEAWAPSNDYAPGGRWFYDCDNRIKPVQDAMAKAGVIVNDKLIRDVRIVDRGIEAPGRVVVSIRRFRGYGR